ncbi:MAG: mechanosensitive ion channel family protein, partial [Steroidobacteraceae bacterium]
FSTARAVFFKSWSGRLLGGAAGRPVVGSITWADLCAALAFLVLALIAHLVAAAIVRRHMRKAELLERKASAGKASAGKASADQAPAEGEALERSMLEARSLERHIFAALGKPVYVLIWAYGVYLAVAPLIIALEPTRGAAAVRGFLDTVFDLGVFVVIFWLFFRFTRVIDVRLELWASRTSSQVDDLLVPLIGRSLRVAVPVLGVIFALPILGLPARYAAVASKGTSILLIGALALILFQAVRIFERGVLMRFDITAKDNLRARKVYTQVHVISKVVDVAIGLLTVSSVLMMFSEVRHFGASLLASAGIAGIIAGIAAQKTLANLLAGFQIAMAQPMRQDDVLIVEGEWGRVEEITLTYVVVHIWDDRRLVLPLTYFVEKPFQNWTRTTSGLLGSVFVWVDYSFPVDEGRKFLKQFIEGHQLWDGRFWNLQVSDSTEHTMQLRVLATSADSSKSWDLRCAIREKFIGFIQSHHAGSLPQVRAQMSATAVVPSVTSAVPA